MEIEVIKLVKKVFQKWPFVLISAFVVGACSFLFYEYYVTPVYESYVTMYIENTTSYNGNISSGDLLSSQALLNTCTVLLNSDSILQKVIERTGVSYNCNQLRRMILQSPVNNTQVLRVAVHSTSPAEAQLIADTLGKVGSSEILRIIKAGNIQLVDQARQNDQPYSPNVILNTLLGALCGLFGSGLFFALKEILDTRIRSDKDINEWSSLPVLGIIPVIEKQIMVVKSDGKKKVRKGSAQR